jgi:hypothetical protein
VEVVGAVGMVGEEPCPNEGHSKLVPLRALGVGGADTRKLAGALEELTCLPDGALAR